MDPRRILLAISGGIAAYKGPELLRVLSKAGHEVRCMLTAEAERFVSPLVLQSLSGRSVRRELFDAGEEGEIDHIGLADWAELVLVAPVTANLMAKMAHGLTPPSPSVNPATPFSISSIQRMTGDTASTVFKTRRIVSSGFPIVPP